MLLGNGIWVMWCGYREKLTQNTRKRAKSDNKAQKSRTAGICTSSGLHVGWNHMKKDERLLAIVRLRVVEVAGLEPTASASRTQRSTKLSHTSIFCFAAFLAATKTIISGIRWIVNNFFLVLQKFFDGTVQAAVETWLFHRRQSDAASLNRTKIMFCFIRFPFRFCAGSQGCACMPDKNRGIRIFRRRF